jgi:hypothetical protein
MLSKRGICLKIDDSMKMHALMFPLILLISIVNLTPKSYFSYGNVTETYRNYMPQKAVGLQTAYEYIVNNTKNNSLVVRIANYLNYTDALNVYNYLYALKSKQVTTKVSYQNLNSEFNFSSIDSLENYSEFSDFNLTSMSNFSTLYLLVGNSVIEYYSTGLKVNPLSPPVGIRAVLAGNPIVQSTTPSVTTIPAVQINTNVNPVFVSAVLVVIALIIIAVYLYNRRSARNSYAT